MDWSQAFLRSHVAMYWSQAGLSRLVTVDWSHACRLLQANFRVVTKVTATVSFRILSSSFFADASTIER
jgi:hypothetical protein